MYYLVGQISSKSQNFWLLVLLLSFDIPFVNSCILNNWFFHFVFDLLNNLDKLVKLCILFLVWSFLLNWSWPFSHNTFCFSSVQCSKTNLCKTFWPFICSSSFFWSTNFDKKHRWIRAYGGHWICDTNSILAVLYAENIRTILMPEVKHMARRRGWMKSL